MAKDSEEQLNNEKSSSSSCFKKISFPCNTIFLISNAIFLVTAVFWFVTVIILHYRTDECNRSVTTPGIFISFSLLVMSLSGFYAAYLKSDCLFRIHFFIFFLWMFVIVAKAAFFTFLNKETGSRLFPGTAIGEYRFEDYSGWVRRLVIKDDDWYRTRRCLVKDHVCNKLNQNISASEFYQMNLTPIQSGCCKPPLSCGLKYEKPNIWTVSRYYNNFEDDCKRWNNSADTLCFDCNSCKAGILADLHNNSFSVTANVLNITLSLSIGITGWFAWLRILRETQK
ncbi:PREDICTED: tetraspanin-13 [Camelina sativa]|uniref:Tetraspanin-13 n=1 Tax=Camelina sativa TaxID=90675 RepID=A0ABM0ZDB0_CAMSA|nr:PREDICTED: tetraspanin-13 [Camelina sativa]